MTATSCIDVYAPSLSLKINYSPKQSKAMADITPKEKAQEIVKKFDLLVTTWDCYHDMPIHEEEILKDTKKCGLIVVDEVLNSFRKILPSSRTWWEEVRAEIEKL